VIKLTNNYRGISLLSTSYKILLHILLSQLSPYIDKIIGDFNVTDQLLIRFSAFIRYRKKKLEYETVFQLFVDFKKSYDSVRREVLYNIRIEFGISIKLFRLIKVCLNET
jgi:hypothetical protein